MNSYERIPGYHGTTVASGNQILEKGDFFLSEKEDSWLGSGVYFWKSVSDASWWASQKCEQSLEFPSQPMILEATLCCPKERFMDLDNEEQMQSLVLVSQALYERLRSGPDGYDFLPQTTPSPDSHNPEKRQRLFERRLRCFCCNYYKHFFNIDLMSFTFPSKDYNAAGFPVYRTQLCATNNDIIYNIRLEADADCPI